jgi:hypothetical protein
MRLPKNLSALVVCAYNNFAYDSSKEPYMLGIGFSAGHGLKLKRPCHPIIGAQSVDDQHQLMKIRHVQDKSWAGNAKQMRV